jgi:hypothetical protein
MGYKKYSDAFRNEAMIKLAINKFNYDKTAKDLGDVTPRTLRNWEKNFVKNGVPELLERAIKRMLMIIPSNMRGDDWAIAIGILMDKWLLMQGQATSRTETILSTLSSIPNDELDSLIAEFESAARDVVTSENGEVEA